MVQAMLGAIILIIAIRSFAALLPPSSILAAALNVNKRACSISQAERAMSSRIDCCLLNGLPNAIRVSARTHIISSARCDMPTRRMQ